MLENKDNFLEKEKIIYKTIELNLIDIETININMQKYLIIKNRIIYPFISKISLRKIEIKIPEIKNG